MFYIEKDNILEYIKEYVPEITLKDPISVHMIGDGDLSQDVEGDGCCNFVFQVSDGNNSYIIKQARPNLKLHGQPMWVERSRDEYEIMTMRSKIVPQYVPKIYHVDFENHVIVMEDCSNMKLVRYAMTRNHRLKEFAVQGAEYLAATHFYLSEFFLETESFRQLIARYMNPQARAIFEEDVFLTFFGAKDYDHSCGEDYVRHCTALFHDPEITHQRYKMRHIYMTKAETLIHGDYHTSNMFADDEHLKVIDMEYTFAAPFSYDLGFIIANIVMQYCSAVYRPFEKDGERSVCLKYLLEVIEMLYENYVKYFYTYWEKDAKIEYKLAEGFKESLALDILKECFGFAACISFSRVTGTMFTADFDYIEDPELRAKAKRLCIDIDVAFFKHWESYNSIEDALEDIMTETLAHLE